MMESHFEKNLAAVRDRLMGQAWQLADLLGGYPNDPGKRRWWPGLEM